jgi:hypothetical protein
VANSNSAKIRFCLKVSTVGPSEIQLIHPDAEKLNPQPPHHIVGAKAFAPPKSAERGAGLAPKVGVYVRLDHPDGIRNPIQGFESEGCKSLLASGDSANRNKRNKREWCMIGVPGQDRHPLGGLVSTRRNVNIAGVARSPHTHALRALVFWVGQRSPRSQRPRSPL